MKCLISIWKIETTMLESDFWLISNNVKNTFVRYKFSGWYTTHVNPQMKVFFFSFFMLARCCFYVFRFVHWSIIVAVLEKFEQLPKMESITWIVPNGQRKWKYRRRRNTNLFEKTKRRKLKSNLKKKSPTHTHTVREEFFRPTQSKLNWWAPFDRWAEWLLCLSVSVWAVCVVYV